MSAPTAEVRAAPTGGVLILVALGLMVLAAIAAFLLLGTGGPTDGRAKMTQVFGVADLPFGLAVESATQMSTGGALVVYQAPGAPLEAPPPPVEHGGDGPKPDAPRTDWSKVEIPAESGAPRQAAFLFVPKGAGRDVLDQMVRNVHGGDRAHFGPEGGTVLVERGRLDFRGWDSDWIHMRTYESGGTFRDAMRVSLSTPDDPCVLTATWPRGTPASRAKLDELISPLVAKR